MEPLYVTVVDHETRQSQSFVFDSPRVRIGREADNDLRLAYPFISRWHAVVELDGRGARLRDLGSANRIYLAGTPLMPGSCVPLKGRTTFTINSLELQVEWRSSVIPAVGSDAGQAEIQGTVESPSRTTIHRADLLERLRVARAASEAARETWERELADALFDLQKNGEQDTLARIQREFGEVGGAPLLQDFQNPERFAAALAAELLPNERPPCDPQEEKEFMSRVAEMCRTFATCFVATQSACEAQAAELGVILHAADSEPLATLQAPEDLLSYLLDWRTSDTNRPMELVQRFAVQLAHQRGHVCGALAALRRVARELEPEEIARSVEVPWPLRTTSSWHRFVERHRALFGSGDEQVSVTIRSYIAEEYCEELARSGVPSSRRDAS